MMPATTTTSPTLRTWPANRLTSRLLENWQTYWPLWLITLGLLWLGTSLSFRSPTEWVTYFAGEEAHQTSLKKELAQLEAIQAEGQEDNGSRISYLSGRLTGAWMGSVIRFALSICLPLGLLLTGVGYYIYWYVARRTLFDVSVGGILGFVLAFGFIWLFWQGLAGSGLVYISRQTVQAGVDSALPTLTLGFWLAQCLVMHLVVRQKEQRELAQAARVAELAALTAQVNPPFIFHALQHLTRAAADEHLPRTAQSLEQLAGIMQYVLEESRKEITDIAHEIGFIRDYLRLQELRLPQRDTIRISTDVTWDGQPAPIVPLLLNPLIENAFKYGISIQHPCYVTVRLHVKEGVLHFTTENSVLPRTDLEVGTGTGLLNVRRRLRLAYPDRHKLTISQQSDHYRVDLRLKLC